MDSKAPATGFAGYMQGLPKKRSRFSSSQPAFITTPAPNSSLPSHPPNQAHKKPGRYNTFDAGYVGLICSLRSRIDGTFVGKDDTVHYFSQGKERILPRTRAIIGHRVTNFHPPACMHNVEGIVADL